jgi:hypothetical protein
MFSSLFAESSSPHALASAARKGTMVIGGCRAQMEYTHAFHHAANYIIISDSAFKIHTIPHLCTAEKKIP